MVDNYPLYVSPKADKDLSDIDLYIANVLNNRTAANKLMDEFEEAFENLRNFSLMYPVVDNEYVSNPRLRKFTVGSYLVFYQVKENRIEIVRVLSGLMNYQDLV